VGYGKGLAEFRRVFHVPEGRASDIVCLNKKTRFYREDSFNYEET
jgi:hypothetical protein